MILIYGAGTSGKKLASFLLTDKSSEEIAFIDDDPTLNGQKYKSLNIYNAKQLEELVAHISMVYFAIPSASSSQRAKIFKLLWKYRLPIIDSPSITDLLCRISSTKHLAKAISGEKLLKRESDEYISAGLPLINKAIVFGGAGSIGSEIVRQLISNKIRNIIVIDYSEFNLYRLEEELSIDVKAKSIDVTFILGSAACRHFVSKIISENRPSVVIHAAAFKHVPIVEKNIVSSAHNNILSTFYIAKACLNNNVEKVIYISSDKAVRSYNLMGATKRFSEEIFNSFNKYSKGKSCFYSVRFGNVVDSSGSVLHVFREQIKKGGPITVTDPNITRYFMTIPEASHLVLSTLSLSTGGEVYLLDMGKPIVIKDLAKNLIELNGLKLKTKNDKEGIEIIYTGLRNGEKLNEELLVTKNSIASKNKKIFYEQPYPVDFDKINTWIIELKHSIENQNKEATIKIIQKCVGDWTISTYIQSCLGWI